MGPSADIVKVFVVHHLYLCTGQYLLANVHRIRYIFLSKVCLDSFWGGWWGLGEMQRISFFGIVYITFEVVPKIPPTIIWSL